MTLANLTPLSAACPSSELRRSDSVREEGLELLQTLPSRSCSASLPRRCRRREVLWSQKHAQEPPLELDCAIVDGM